MIHDRTLDAVGRVPGRLAILADVRRFLASLGKLPAHDSPMSQRSRRYRLAVLLAPAVGLISAATAMDLVRGGRIIEDWGGGQTVMVFVGMLVGCLAFAMHRKAMRDERESGRPYVRTIVFLVLPLALLIFGPLVAAEWFARILPTTVISPNAYQQPDDELGFSLRPSRRYRIVSGAKDFDIRVEVDSGGCRIDPSEPPVKPSEADVVVLGDSHAFGFGIPEQETLTSQLTKLLRDENTAPRVLNGGVPGYGIGQMVLKMGQLERASPGTVIVLWINPVNDLVNLSSSVDYHFPKPHALLIDGQLTFQQAPPAVLGQAFLFSDPFDRLNTVFGLRRHFGLSSSRLYQRITRSRQPIPPAQGGIILLEDQTRPSQYLIDDQRRIAEDPLLYASRYWPELQGFAPERETLALLCEATLRKAVQIARANDWRLLALVAPEGYQYQTYARDFFADVLETARRNASLELGLDLGWSRRTVIKALEANQIPALAPDYDLLVDADERFLQNDDHTSAAGHQAFAIEIAGKLIDQGWLDPVPAVPVATP